MHPAFSFTDTSPLLISTGVDRALGGGNVDRLLGLWPWMLSCTHGGRCTREGLNPKQ